MRPLKDIPVKHRQKHVAFVCENCGTAHMKSWKQRFFDSVKQALIVVSAVIVFFVAILLLTNRYAFIDMASTSVMNLKAFVDGDPDVEISVKGNNETAQLFSLINQIDHKRYREVSLSEAFLSTDIYELVGGDCKTSSIYFTRIAQKHGFDAFVSCSAENWHCVSAVLVEGGTYIIDMAYNEGIGVSKVNNTREFWGEV